MKAALVTVMAMTAAWFCGVGLAWCQFADRAMSAEIVTVERAVADPKPGSYPEAKWGKPSSKLAVRTYITGLAGHSG